MIVSPSGANRAEEIVPARKVTCVKRGIGVLRPMRPLATKLHTATERRLHRWTETRQAGWLAREDRRSKSGTRRRVEWTRSRDHLVHHHAKRKYVRTPIYMATGDLLR